MTPDQKVEKTGVQIELFLFRRDYQRRLEFLLLHRVPSRGGFWQPLTGGHHVGEALADTLLRECLEETGISITRADLYVTGYRFEFIDNGRLHKEYVFGAFVEPRSDVVLSDEHDAYEWLPFERALERLKWDENKQGLVRLAQIVECKEMLDNTAERIDV